LPRNSRKKGNFVRKSSKAKSTSNPRKSTPRTGRSSKMVKNIDLKLHPFHLEAALLEYLQRLKMVPEADYEIIEIDLSNEEVKLKLKSNEG
jgi:hypothetical protein